MEQDRKQYRLVRLLTGGVTPLVLAAALVAFARWHDPSWEPGAQAAGICRELIAGTTEGRQALFGSCWSAPLPVLAYLPFAWLLPEPAAGCAAFFAAWLFAFWAVREAIKATGQSGWRIVMAQAAIAAMAASSGSVHALRMATALTAGLTLLAAAGVADWAAYRRLRDVVVAGTASALLALCGFPTFAPAALAALLLPLGACGDRETRARASAWLLLGALPLAYAAGVWMLLNRLVLGDPLFFLRSLGHVVPQPWKLWFVLALPVAVMAPALAATWFCDARNGGRSGGGPTAGSATLIAFAVSLLACGKVLQVLGLAWGTGALDVCALAVLMIALARLSQPLYRLAASLILFVWLSTFWFGGASSAGGRAPESREAVCQSVEAYVNARTPYGRVFVLGYTGLDLLRGYSGERLMANLDLHVGALRRAYKGQNLYVLVPRPVGAVRAESVFWRYPGIYERGGDRLLFAEAFGPWHLFEVVTAPTQEQLDEWKKARER